VEQHRRKGLLDALPILLGLLLSLPISLITRYLIYNVILDG